MLLLLDNLEQKRTLPVMDFESKVAVHLTVCTLVFSSSFKYLPVLPSVTLGQLVL